MICFIVDVFLRQEHMIWTFIASSRPCWRPSVSSPGRWSEYCWTFVIRWTWTRVLWSHSSAASFSFTDKYLHPPIFHEQFLLFPRGTGWKQSPDGLRLWKHFDFTSSLLSRKRDRPFDGSAACAISCVISSPRAWPPGKTSSPMWLFPSTNFFNGKLLGQKLFFWTFGRRILSSSWRNSHVFLEETVTRSLKKQSRVSVSSWREREEIVVVFCVLFSDSVDARGNRAPLEGDVWARHRRGEGSPHQQAFRQRAVQQCGSGQFCGDESALWGTDCIFRHLTLTSSVWSWINSPPYVAVGQDHRNPRIELITTMLQKGMYHDAVRLIGEMPTQYATTFEPLAQEIANVVHYIIDPLYRRYHGYIWSWAGKVCRAGNFPGGVCVWFVKNNVTESIGCRACKKRKEL